MYPSACQYHHHIQWLMVENDHAILTGHSVPTPLPTHPPFTTFLSHSASLLPSSCFFFFPLMLCVLSLAHNTTPALSVVDDSSARKKEGERLLACYSSSSNGKGPSLVEMVSNHLSDLACCDSHAFHRCLPWSSLGLRLCRGSTSLPCVADLGSRFKQSFESN